MTGLTPEQRHYFVVQTRTDAHAATLNIVDSADSAEVSAPGRIQVPISGTVTFGGSPLAGVVLDGLPESAVTDAAGAYSATVQVGWSGTVTPALPGIRVRAGLAVLHEPGRARSDRRGLHGHGGRRLHDLGDGIRRRSAARRGDHDGAPRKPRDGRVRRVRGGGDDGLVGDGDADADVLHIRSSVAGVYVGGRATRRGRTTRRRCRDGGAAGADRALQLDRRGQLDEQGGLEDSAAVSGRVRPAGDGGDVERGDGERRSCDADQLGQPEPDRDAAGGDGGPDLPDEPQSVRQSDHGSDPAGVGQPDVAPVPHL